MSNKLCHYLFTGAIFFLLLSLGQASNKALIAAKVKELTELNRLVLSSIEKPEQFNGKQIFVKVKILPSSGKKIKFKIEKISVDKIKPSAQDDENTIYLQGKVKKSDSNNYKVDLSHILPNRVAPEGKLPLRGMKNKTVIADKKTGKDKK